MQSRGDHTTKEVRDFILDNLDDFPKDIGRITSAEFGITRQSVFKHLKALKAEGYLKAKGITRSRTYSLVERLKKQWTIAVDGKIAEDVLWQKHLAPLVKDLPANVQTICAHGFLEMANNVISHSSSETITFAIARRGLMVQIRVHDFGIGIFEKIKIGFGLDDPKQALFELSKGRLTTDPKSHTGEGIFFTSRMFDRFAILSGNLFYTRERRKNQDWLIESGPNEGKVPGTIITMRINESAKHTTKGVFDEFTTDDEDHSFSRTHVPVKLANYGKDQLMSRSAARRVLARFERFREVMLDYQGVEEIGQSFADEIYRVFHNEHPDVELVTVNASPDIWRMINRAKTQSSIPSQIRPL